MSIEPTEGEPQGHDLTPEQAIEQLRDLRMMVMPILEAFKEQYEGRVRPGYPTLVDNVEHGGVFGINMDPGFGAYFMTDGKSVYAELHRISLRTDALSNANFEKFAGRPVQERIDLDFEGDIIYQARNIISQLLNRWNTQQTVIYRVDS